VRPITIIDPINCAFLQDSPFRTTSSSWSKRELANIVARERKTIRDRSVPTDSKFECAYVRDAIARVLRALSAERNFVSGPFSVTSVRDSVSRDPRESVDEIKVAPVAGHPTRTADEASQSFRIHSRMRARRQDHAVGRDPNEFARNSERLDRASARAFRREERSLVALATSVYSRVLA